MSDVSDLALERAKTALARAMQDKSSDPFVAELANVTSNLLATPIDRQAIPKPTQTRLFKEFASALEELASVDINRSSIFWLFFHAAALRFAAAYFRQTFGTTDIELQTFLDENIKNFSPAEERPRINYLLSGLPRELLSEHFSELLERARSAFTSEEGRLAQENTKAAELVGRLGELDRRSGELEGLLKGQLERLNFVGLSRAFERMVQSTTQDLVAPLRGLRVIALLLIGTPLATMALLSGGAGTQWWHISAPMAAVELVLFYLFRVLLLRHQSLRAQLLQLDLRYSVCAFVEGYAHFAAQIRKSPDDKTLEKFEALVFSGISPDPQNVPSQFDGLESLTNIFRALRGKE